LVLDEPTSGPDLLLQEEIRALLRETRSPLAGSAAGPAGCR
jgi:hypothetical protein